MTCGMHAFLLAGPGGGRAEGLYGEEERELEAVGGECLGDIAEGCGRGRKGPGKPRWEKVL